MKIPVFDENGNHLECVFDGCDTPRVAKGYCRTHWRQLKRGDELRPKYSGKWFNPDGSRMICTSEAGCSEPVETMGLCNYHYQNQHYQKGKGVNKSKRNVKKRDPITGERLKCHYSGCKNYIHYSGYCSGHAEMKKKGQQLRPLRHRVSCPVKNCHNTMMWKAELCPKHMALKSKYGVTSNYLIDLFKEGRCANGECLSTLDLQVDHDHACCAPGKYSNSQVACGNCIRGVLCGKCNRALGLIDDNPQILRGLIEYLENS